MIATTPFVWLKESEIANLEGDIVWGDAVSAEPLDGYIPLHPYAEKNIDYKKEWVLAQKQSKAYERLWIQYRDMAVELDKELKELKKGNELLEAKRITAYNIGHEDAMKELTDEEILECWNETHPAVVCLNAELPLFARAILRKAQEK